MRKRYPALIFILSLDMAFPTVHASALVSDGSFARYFVILAVFSILFNAIIQLILVYLLGIKNRKALIAVFLLSLVLWPTIFLLALSLFPILSVFSVLLAVLIDIIIKIAVVNLIDKSIPVRKIITIMVLAQIISPLINSFVLSALSMLYVWMINR